MMNKFFKTSVLACAVLAAVAAYAAPSGPAATVEVLARPAMHTPRAPKMAMLDIVRAADRLVAAGEAGVVLLSDDGGKSWRQAKVPVSVSITALQFVDAKVGYATGHMGVVLKTTDGGETWTKLLDGVAAAALVLKQAETQAAGEEGAERALRDARRLVDDGPDKPFLNLHFQDADTGFVFGAYNLIFRTADGGKTWTPWQDRVANPRGFHLYGMAAAGGALFIAGEQGLLLSSTDGGAHFEPLASPYKGSWFGIVGAADGALVAYGLRGNAWHSTDQGTTWTQVETGVPVAISAGRLLADGRLALVAQSGAVLLSADGGARFEALAGLPPLPLSGLAQAPDGQLVAASLAGAMRLAPPQR